MANVVSVAGLRVQTDLWWGWLALVFLLTGLTLAWLYRRLYRLYPRAQATTLLALKLAAASVLLLGLLRPALVREERDLASARVMLLIDESRSMSTRDGALDTTRLDDAGKIAFDTVLARLKRKLSVETVAFSNTVRAVEDAGELNAAGEGTDIVNALLESAKRFAGSGRVGAFVLVTDGGDESVVESSFTAGAPVYSIAIGADLNQFDDLRIARVEHPDQVDAQTQFEIQVEVSASGKSDFLKSVGNPLLTLTENGKVVTTQSVPLSNENRQSTVTLRVQAPENGAHRYHLQLPVFKSEPAPLNNERDFVVEVRDPSLRVLYYASELGQDYKPLRNALKADPGIEFIGLLRTGPDRVLLQGQRSDDKIENSFPESIETLRKFKCLILGNCEAHDFSAAALKAMEQYVTEGGAIVVTGGPRAFGNGGWARTPLAAIFPWQIASSEPPFRQEEIAVELTPLGRAHPIFSGISGIGAATGRLSQIEGYNTPGPLRPGAQGLLVAAMASGERPAIIAVNHYGKGKALGIASNTLWKWSTAGGEGAKAYDAFWRQAARFLTSSKDDGSLLKLTADKQGRYRAGSRANVTARVLDRSLQPLSGATISASLKRLDGSVIRPIAFREDKTAGSYCGEVDLTATGDYRLQVSASDAKGVLETRELLLPVGVGANEGSHLSVNFLYLEELAAKSGGAVRAQEHADELVDLVLAGVKAKTHYREISLLWDSPIYFLLFAALMILEWIARRRMNLI
ncbi:MAG: hypothetical protein V1899_07995 [Planctomycetota bacterium]